jgi:hypothetical protein
VPLDFLGRVGQRPCQIREGRFSPGGTYRAEQHAGFSVPPPFPGDPPQIWIDLRGPANVCFQHGL